MLTQRPIGTFIQSAKRYSELTDGSLRGRKFEISPPTKMKNNYLHTGNTTKKSSARARLVFCALGIVAAVTLAGFALHAALAAGPEHPSMRSSKSQIAAENSDASDNHGIGKN